MISWVANHRRALALFIFWLAAAAGISVSNTLAALPSSIVLSASMVLTLLVFFFLARYSGSFGQFILSLDLSVVTLGQSARVVGGSLLLYLTHRGTIPGAFGIPAGLGDLAIAATAPLVAFVMDRNSKRGRRMFLWWHFAGLLDLAISIALGSLASPIPGIFAHGSSSSQIISHFPFSLIPLLIGPLLISFHLAALTKTFWLGLGLPPRV